MKNKKFGITTTETFFVLAGLYTSKSRVSIFKKIRSKFGVVVDYKLFYDGYIYDIIVVNQEKFSAFLLEYSDYILNLTEDNEN